MTDTAARLASIDRYEAALRHSNKHSLLDDMIALLAQWARESVREASSSDERIPQPPALSPNLTPQPAPRPEGTPRVDALIDSKPGLWRQWTDGDFHDLSKLAKALERESAETRRAAYEHSQQMNDWVSRLNEKIDALEARSAIGAIPEGWKLVPVAPSGAMLQAVAPFPEHLRAEHPDPEDPWHEAMEIATLSDQEFARSTYNLMLAAAPEAPSSVARSEGWISVSERQPEKEGSYLAWVASKSSVYGGWREVLHYGAWDFYDADDNWKDAQNEDGQVYGNGWHREQEEGGDTMTYPLEPRFTTTEAVTHWMPLPERPALSAIGERKDG